MHIRDLARQSGVPAPTIRYYESIGLLPQPDRAANNYRQYTDAAVERVRFIASARSLGLSLAEMADILAARDAGVAPCTQLLTTLEERLREVEHRIAEMLRLREALLDLHTQGSTLPRDDVAGEHCICALLRTYHGEDPIPIQPHEEMPHD